MTGVLCTVIVLLTLCTCRLIYYNAVTMIEPGAFNGLAALTTLDLGYNYLASLPAGTFDGLVDIETMYVCDTCFLSYRSHCC